MPNLGHIRDGVDTLRTKVHSLIKIHMTFPPLVIPPVVKISPPHGPRNFDLVAKDDKEVPISRTN